jgi:hypothetical protein
MIPLYRTHRMESAVNLLVRQFRHVLVRAHYDNAIRIRFRAGKLRDPRVFFGKVPSQFDRWQKKGGVLISWWRPNMNFTHDACLFVECPKSIEEVRRALAMTTIVGVIYEPPTWRPHEETIRKRTVNRHPASYPGRMERLAIIREYVEDLPWLTSRALASLLRARQRELSQSSTVPASRESSARSPDTLG